MGLELDREPRAHDHGGRQRVSSSADDPKDWYPKKNRDHRWLVEGARRVVVAGLVLGCVVIAWGWLNGKGLPGPLQELVGMVSARVSGPPAAFNDTDGVACFTNLDGEYLVFTDDKGTDNVVESPAQVPAKYRGSVRCVTLKK